MKTRYKTLSPPILFSCIGYILFLLIFIQFSHDSYTTASRIIAWLVLVLGSLPLLMFWYKKYSHPPVIELIMLSYVNAYSLPIFFESKNTILAKILYPKYEPVTQCLLLVLLAITALWFGFKISPFFLKVVRFPKFVLRCNNNKLFYFGSFLCVLSLFAWRFRFGSLEGLVNIVASSDLGLALIALLFYKQQLSKSKKIFSLCILFLLVAKGISIGMTQHIMQPMAIWLVCRWLVIKKLELRFIVLGIILYVMLQPVKLEYRGIAWTDKAQSNSVFHNLVLFSESFYNFWFISNKNDKLVESVYTRTSLLLQTSHIIDWTPHVVPFRNGETLYYMLITLVPRFIWDNKPIAQQANIDYAIDYGITSSKGTQRAMFGVGHLGEAFMNFGFVGVFPVFMLLGALSYLPIYMVFIPKSKSLDLSMCGNNVDIAPTALIVTSIFKFIF